jgi:hypothetical protein
MQDVLPLIIGLYYTPIISSFEIDNKFYLVFTYPSNRIKFEMPRCEYTYGRSFTKHYKTDKIQTFIQDLWNDDYCELHFDDPVRLDIILYDDCIDITHKEVEMNIEIVNTETSRGQLANELIKYENFMNMYSDDF